MTLAPFVRIVAQGKRRARPLTQGEARESMALILADDAALRDATQQESGCTLERVDLDWPCYTAGRTRGVPLFALAAKLMALAGYKVALHGWNSHQGTAADLRGGLQAAGLFGGGLSYSPLETLNPIAFRLLKLRETLGLRSCINTVLRRWNPLAARASVQGVFHPSYRGLQWCAATLLGDCNLTVIKGGGGDFERHPAKDTAIFGLQNGMEIHTQASALLTDTRRLHEADRPIALASLWSRAQEDPFASATVIGTAALAFWTVTAEKSVRHCTALASELWDTRKIQERSPL